MGTISDKLSYLNNTKKNIKQAIINKGVTVSDTDTFRSYANKINSIQTGIEPKLQEKSVYENGIITPDYGYDGLSKVTVDVQTTGGGSIGDSGGKYLVQVIDYDGTVLKSDHLNTGAIFRLPNAPTNHERLLFQEWSSPVDITDNTVIVEDQDITIGAVYTTKSGLNEFDITLTKATGLIVNFNVADGTVNWGDGTSQDVTELISHTYSEYGTYTITWSGTTSTSDVTRALFGQTQSNSNYYVTDVRLVNINARNALYILQYCKSLKSVTISKEQTRISQGFLQCCYSLKSITIPSTITSLSGDLCSYCFTLESAVIPKGTTYISVGEFSHCYSLKSITIPSTVTYIESSAFNNCSAIKNLKIPNTITSFGRIFTSCYNMEKYDMTSLTAVPTLSDTNAFNDINGLCKIYVPDALYDEWIVATNWSSLADYIYKASEMED